MVRESFTAADMAAPFSAAPHGWHSQRDVPVVMKPRRDVVFRSGSDLVHGALVHGIGLVISDPRVVARQVRKVRATLSTLRIRWRVVMR